LREKGSGTLVGYCGLLVQTVDGLPELEIGYSLLPTHWGRGYATEAALTCKAFARTHHLAPSLISIISLTNVTSQRVALNLGMYVKKGTRKGKEEAMRYLLPPHLAPASPGLPGVRRDDSSQRPPTTSARAAPTTAALGQAGAACAGFT
jgi:hypothetical protein